MSDHGIQRRTEFRHDDVADHEDLRISLDEPDYSFDVRNHPLIPIVNVPLVPIVNAIRKVCIVSAAIFAFGAGAEAAGMIDEPGKVREHRLDGVVVLDRKE